MNKDQIKIDVGQIVVADAQEVAGALVYGTPRTLCGASQVNVAYNKSPLKHYESGEAVINRTYVSEATLGVQTTTMSLADKMDLLYSIDPDGAGASYEEGGDTDEPKKLAVGFWVKAAKGYMCTWFYDASAAPPDETYQTSTEGGPQINPETVEFSCIRRPGDRLLRRSKFVSTLEAAQEFLETVDPDTTTKAVSALVYKVTAPAKSGTPQASHDAGTGYTAAIAWLPTGGTFAASTAYTATVTYTAAAGYVFGSSITAADVQGLPTSGGTATVTRVSDTVVTIVVAYTATDA